MFFKKKKRLVNDASSLYAQCRKEAERKAAELAEFVDISPQQLERIFAETEDMDVLSSAVLAKRTEPDIQYICDKYRVSTKWLDCFLTPIPVQDIIDAACLGDRIGSTREFTPHLPVTTDTLLTPQSIETDDSILTRAVYDAIRANPDEPDFRTAYLRAYHEKPDADYGSGFIQWAQNTDNRTGYGSCGDGCVMRISPIVAFYNDYDDVIKHTVSSVMPTHNHTESVKAAVVFAGALWMVKAGADKSEILAYVKSAYTQTASLPEGYRPIYKSYVFSDEPYRTNIPEKRSLFAGFAVPMCVDHFAHTDSFETCCLSILSGFCDADTLCCMAGALCAMYQQRAIMS